MSQSQGKKRFQEGVCGCVNSCQDNKSEQRGVRFSNVRTVGGLNKRGFSTQVKEKVDEKVVKT